MACGQGPISSIASYVGSGQLIDFFTASSRSRRLKGTRKTEPELSIQSALLGPGHNPNPFPFPKTLNCRSGFITARNQPANGVLHCDSHRIFLFICSSNLQQAVCIELGGQRLGNEQSLSRQHLLRPRAPSRAFPCSPSRRQDPLQKNLNRRYPPALLIRRACPRSGTHEPDHGQRPKSPNQDSDRRQIAHQSVPFQKRLLFLFHYGFRQSILLFRRC